MVHVAYDERFRDCPSCTKHQKRKLNCDGETEGMIVLEVGDRTYNKCPVQDITNTSYALYRLYSHYKLGHLPASGGIGDQSYKIIRSFEIISGADGEAQSRMLETSKKKQSQKPKINIKRK